MKITGIILRERASLDPQRISKEGWITQEGFSFEVHGDWVIAHKLDGTITRMFHGSQVKYVSLDPKDYELEVNGPPIRKVK